MRRSLAGKRVLVTGASSGIGRALAIEAGRRGAAVVLASRSAGPLEETARVVESVGGKALAVPTDVTIPEQRAAVVQAANDHFGGLDILVNNAGVAAHGHFIDLDPSILRKTMEVNFFALAEMCRLAIPRLTDGNQPLIINISSMTGRRGVPAWTDYAASKFAVCGFSESLRAELVRFGIDLLLVIPGLTSSSFGDHLLERKGRLPANFSGGLSPETVARTIWRAAERNRHEIWIERDARLLLWVNWLLPRFVDRRLAALVRKLYAPEIAELERARATTSSPSPAR